MPNSCNFAVATVGALYWWKRTFLRDNLNRFFINSSFKRSNNYWLISRSDHHFHIRQNDNRLLRRTFTSRCPLFLLLFLDSSFVHRRIGSKSPSDRNLSIFRVACVQLKCPSHNWERDSSSTHVWLRLNSSIQQ